MIIFTREVFSLLLHKQLINLTLEGKVCYQYGKDSSELERMDYLEFIARVTSHIPDKGQVMIRYHRSPQAHLHGRTASPSSNCPEGTLDGS